LFRGELKKRRKAVVIIIPVDATPIRPRKVVTSPVNVYVSIIVEKEFLQVIVNGNFSLGCSCLNHHSKLFCLMVAEQI